MARRVSNNGIGALYGTFDIHKTGDDYDLTPKDVGKAVDLSGNNEVNFGLDAGLLLGRLEHVQESLVEGVQKSFAMVQMQGVMRLPFVSVVPNVGEKVVVNGRGCVRWPLINEDHTSRGTVLAVNREAEMCDVLL